MDSLMNNFEIVLEEEASMREAASNELNSPSKSHFPATHAVCYLWAKIALRINLSLYQLFSYDFVHCPS